MKLKQAWVWDGTIEGLEMLEKEGLAHQGVRESWDGNMAHGGSLSTTLYKNVYTYIGKIGSPKMYCRAGWYVCINEDNLVECMSEDWFYTNGELIK